VKHRNNVSFPKITNAANTIVHNQASNTASYRSALVTQSGGDISNQSRKLLKSLAFTNSVPCLKENTTLHHYKDQLVNAV
jgi:hypothetical protein